MRFEPIEACELLSLFLNVEVPASVSEAITARTGGWAVGLRLAALSLEGRLDFSELYPGSRFRMGKSCWKPISAS